MWTFLRCKRAYDRAQEMSKDGVVSQSTLDDAERNYIMAVNKRDVARAQLTVNKAKVAQAQAQVEKDRGQPEAVRRAAQLYDHHCAYRRRGAVA